MRPSRWYHLMLAVFVTTLIISNIIAVKLIRVFGLLLPAAVILFPITYIFGDILTEVYGYAKARRAIWIGFACNLLAVAAITLADLLPADPQWRVGAFQSSEQASSAYHAILGQTPRLLLASFLAYLVGEFLNAIVLAKMKVRTEGRWLWTRTIASTLVGQGADSAIFISVAFFGMIPIGALTTAILHQWLFKSSYEALATPLTYAIVNALKRVEGVDVYDRETGFHPLKF